MHWIKSYGPPKLGVFATWKKNLQTPCTPHLHTFKTLLLVKKKFMYFQNSIVGQTKYIGYKTLLIIILFIDINS